MSRARDLSRLSNPTNFTVDVANSRVGLGSTSPTAKLAVAGIVSATAFYGDGSNLEGVASAGLGTALSDEGATSVIYYTDKTLSVTGNTTVDVPDASCHWYIVNADNTFGEGFDWETAPWYSVEGLQDIANLHDDVIDSGYQYTVEALNNAKSN